MAVANDGRDPVVEPEGLVTVTRTSLVFLVDFVALFILTTLLGLLDFFVVFLLEA